MIRRARHTDAPAIETLIRKFHARSKYASRCTILPKRLQTAVLGMIGQQGQIGPQGTHVAVAEREKRIVGFIAGVLQPIYFVGDKLEASDAYFVNEGTIGDTLGLVDSYVAWASAIRSVIEIKLSYTDTIPGAEKVARLYERKGFAKVGEIFEMRNDVAQGLAA